MTYIPAEIRRLVISRSGECCEYCRISREDHVLPFEIDHITSQKHGGPSTAENLCLSCWDCNNAKGSDIAGADPVTKKATFLFHPRQQRWNDHFQLKEAVIVPLTPEGRVTLFVLQLNHPDRLIEREMLIALSRYPSERFPESSTSD